MRQGIEKMETTGRHFGRYFSPDSALQYLGFARAHPLNVKQNQFLTQSDKTLTEIDNITPKKAWHILQTQSKSVLVDVRTQAEWALVGLPDLASIGRPLVKIEWQIAPQMQLNPNFITTLEQTVTDKSVSVLFLCRSGARSAAAAQAAKMAGYKQAFNIENGFEGARNADGQRGQLNGWKVAQLPWRQN